MVSVLAGVLMTSNATAQWAGPGPHYPIEPDDTGAKSLSEAWGDDWTEPETEALEDYMDTHVGMRELIGRSQRPFHFGVSISTRPGLYGGLRKCAWKPSDGDWECYNTSSCYCSEDPACDPFAEGLPGYDAECANTKTSVFAFQRYDAYRQLLAHDFNYVGTCTELEMPAPFRRKNANPYFGFPDEILADFAPENDMKGSAQTLLYMMPAWIPYTILTPYPSNAPTVLANLLFDFIDIVMPRYASSGVVNRWTVANEAVRDDDPPVTLKYAVTADPEDDVWALNDGYGHTLGTQFPQQHATIDNTNVYVDVLGLIDDEIIRIETAPDSNGLIGVSRGQGGTSASAHAAGAILYTIKNLIKPEYPNMKPHTEDETDPELLNKYWLWHTITDTPNDRAGDISDVFLVEAFKRARYWGPDLKLLYCDYGCIFPTKTTLVGQTQVTVVNAKFERVNALKKLLIASGAPIDGIGVQMYVPAWACLTADAGGEDGLRLNPKQLRGIVEGLTLLAEGVSIVAISEMDIRMGITSLGNYEYDAMKDHVGEGKWESLSIADRQKWQGYVYREILNAALAVPFLYSVNLWGIIDNISWLNLRDPYGWPWCPKYPDPGACNPDLLGGTSYDSQTGTWNGRYLRKPAYYGVREAIQNYFGTAFSVKDVSGNELVRFVNNGNVVVLKGLLNLNTSQTTLNEKGTANSFIVKDSAGDKKAVVEPTGEVFLAGGLTEEVTSLSIPSGKTAFVVKNAAGDAVSLIDCDGHLVIRGKVIVQGVSHTLEHNPNHAGDPYSTYN